jgi:16S rRNA (cytosine967-C5)-methyltransferase
MSGSGKAKRPSQLRPGLTARVLAARVLHRVERERRSLDEGILLERVDGLTSSDIALAKAILAVSFRRFRRLRAILERAADAGEIPQAGLLRPILITAAAQILFLEVADHAAVDLAVELAKQDPHAKHYARLVNAILRRIAGSKHEWLAEPMRALDEAPALLGERWASQWGQTLAEAIAQAHLKEPPVDLTIFRGRDAVETAIPGRWLPGGSYRLGSREAIADLPGYAEGNWQVQDVAASMPARMLGAKPGWQVLDLCAAPGGKTAQLALTGARVTAVERSASRAERLRENLARLRLEAEIVISPAEQYQETGFDAVLLDAPCSATGTIRRHPEVAWTKTLADILALAAQQARLLAHAARAVRPGGLLVYATCSLEREEGEAQIERFLKENREFELLPLAPGEVDIPASMVTEEGYLRSFPCHLSAEGGADGFFAARLQRREGSVSNLDQ